MANPAGESNDGVLRRDFDRRLMIQFRGSVVLRQSVFGRLGGYEDVNDADRLRHDPAMRWIVGGKAAMASAASPSQMGRFETRWLAAKRNLSALADLSAVRRAASCSTWIRASARRMANRR